MTRICALLTALFLLVLPAPVLAQQSVWLQIEAQPTLTQAETRARAYAAAFPNVAGYRIGTGWYAIVLGPYSRNSADAELRSLRRERLIPGDAFIAFPQSFGQQFWPVSADGRAADATPDPAPAPQTPVVETPVIQPQETVAEARRSEAALTRAERELLQEALQWDGFYTAAIDGAFGAGTRRAMADYQRSMNYEPTGVLTTRQRTELVDSYQGLFAALGLETVNDPEAGIEMLLPMGRITRDTAEPPFVRYAASTDDGVRVLLISQEGDQNTLFGLYDIMQTLEVVPTTGARDRNSRSFTLTGQGPDLHSYTYAELAQGAVKGFTLIWKPADARVMERVVSQMKASFRAVPDVVLPDIAGNGADQRIDLIAGLQIRTPDLSRSGFFIDNSGTVLTTTQVLGQCERLTIGDDHEATVAARDDRLGIAVLRPDTPLAPVAFAAFQPAIPRLQSEVAVAGFSYGDVLDLPSVTFGTLADIRGLQGETDMQRLELEALPGDAGGPVFDQTGSVLGLLKPRDNSGGRTLPADVSFAVNVASIAEFLSANGIAASASDGAPVMAPEDLVTMAGDMTVLVSCWN